MLPIGKAQPEKLNAENIKSAFHLGVFDKIF